MKHLILDLYSIKDYPEIISFNHKDYTLWVSKDYLDKEILKHDFRIPQGAIIELLSKATEKGFVKQFDRDEQHIPKFVEWRSLNYILKYINFFPSLNFQRKLLCEEGSTKNVFIVSTDDKILERIEPHEVIKELIRNGAEQDNQLLQLGKKVSSSDFRFKYLPTVLLILLIIFLASINQIFGQFEETTFFKMSIGILSILIICGLYVVRTQNRIAYGGLEIVVGLFAVFYPLETFNDGDYRKFEYLKIITGIYIVLRGIVNIEEVRGKEFFYRYFSERWKAIKFWN